MNSDGVTANVVPHTPTLAPIRGPSTTDSQLDVRWSFITDPILTGGSAITSYSLFINDGNGGNVFTEVMGDTLGPYTLNSIVITSGIASGATYNLKYKVKNIYGFSQFSPIASITSMTIPGAPTNVAVTYNLDQVEIDWTAPAFTGGF